MPESNVVQLRPVKKAKLYKKVPYPKNPRMYSERPIRLWDCKRKKVIRWAYYKDEIRAVEAAVKAIHWAKPGESIDVYHSRSRRHIAQFSKKADGSVMPWFSPTLTLPTSKLKD